MTENKKISIMGVRGAGKTCYIYAMAQVMQAYPGYGAIQMQAQKVDQEYGPQLQKTANEINALKDQAAKQAAYDKNYAPTLKKYNDAMAKIYAPVEKNIQAKLETVRAQKNLQLVVADPRVILSAEPNTTLQDVTPDVVKLLK